jgi:tetratricopeptide (TPR) repeat protein
LTVNFDTALSRVDSDVKTIDDEPGLMDFAHNFGQLAEESRIVAHLHSSVRHSGQLKAFMSQVGEPVLGPAASVILAAKNAGPLLLVGYAAADPDLRPFFCRKSKCDEDDGVWKTTRSDPASGRDLHIDLDPGHSFDPKPTERAIRQVLDGFDDADVLRLVGVLRNCANESSAAIRDLTLAQGARPSLPGALELGRALEAAGLFRRAARALGSPPSRTEAMYGAWALERGFYLRQSGDFSRALDQYVEARQCLERADPQNARTLASLAYREIECRVLMASGTRPESRSSALRACYELIRACERWTALVPARPHFELDFYRAEIDLLDGNYGRALDEYSEFERRSARWRPGYWSTVAEIRKCLCLIGLGHRAAALRLWRASLRHAARDRSLLRLFQNLAVAPMFVGGADAWFWRSRRVFAVHVYPRYEALKSGWLSVTAALRQG